MKLSRVPPWIKDPMQYAQTLENRRKSIQKALDAEAKMWDTTSANKILNGGDSRMKFAEMPREAVYTAMARKNSIPRITSLEDGSVLVFKAISSSPAPTTKNKDATRSIALTVDDKQFIVPPKLATQLEKALAYAAKHGKTPEDQLVEVVLGTHDTGNGKYKQREFVHA